MQARTAHQSELCGRCSRDRPVAAHSQTTFAIIAIARTEREDGQMSAHSVGKVALVWRGDRAARDAATPSDRLRPVFEALATRGIAAEAAVYGDAMVAEVREQLLAVDGVLVWVDPIGGGEDRTVLDALLREVSSAGVWVSAHPETIQKMGTKEVLYRTRGLGWGTDTHLYATSSEFTEQFPARLSSGLPRVLKQNRGNGGIGVWKVELVTDAPVATVRVQQAMPRDAVTEVVALGTFMDRCREYFSGSGRLIDQAFAPRLPEGMIRAYLVQDEVVGFARQQPKVPSPGAEVPPPEKVLGLPAAKTMYGPSEPEFATLKSRLEQEWVPALEGLVSLDAAALPLLWDADFLYGPRTEAGADTYILCEINVSSVSPFPDQAVPKLADAVFARFAGAGS
jgi:hypothetical protein